MKILLASIIIGLLSLSPAFAQSSMDKNQKETNQDRYGQTGDSYQESIQGIQPDDLLKSDEGRQVNETDQDLRYGQTVEQRQIMPKSDDGYQPSPDLSRTHRATEVEPQAGYRRVTSDLITADDLQGASVYGSNNESVADVDEVLMTTEGKVERFVVDVGGFLGIGARSIAIDVDEADIHKDANNDVRVYIPMSKEELRQMPEYKRGY